jgi:hypothetical protein
VNPFGEQARALERMLLALRHLRFVVPSRRPR